MDRRCRRDIEVEVFSVLDRIAALLNPYGRQAWLQPVLVSFGQTLLVCAVLFPEWITIWNGVRGILFALGVTLVMHCVRDPGKALEKELFEQWDGIPSTAMLRHRDNRIDPVTKARYRAYLARVVPRIGGITLEVERRDPMSADEIYGSAAGWLRAQTRDRTRFGLLFQENVGYGFRRNTLVLRRWAKWLDAAGFLLCSGAIGVALSGVPAEVAAPLSDIVDRVGWAAVIFVLHWCLFQFGIRERWVGVAAKRYARQLLEACDTLAREDRCNTAQDS